MRAVVYHDYYGCETGCCGHYVELYNGTEKVNSQFTFFHPHVGSSYAKFAGILTFKGEDMPEEVKEFVRDKVTKHFGEQHCADIDWENCILIDD